LVSATPGQQSGNVWQQWLCERTGLVQAEAGEVEGAGPLPFPDAVVQQLPLSVRRPAAQRAAILATWTLTVAGLVAFGGSAWHNHWLARQVFEAPRHVVASVQPEPAQPATEILRLDSLSLFPSGSAQLKSGATQVLVRALIDIKARPGELIVVAGHTDATGQADSNLRLSRARAEAVRDWIRTMGGIPDSCFAVQGLGASQPIASNDTEQGRAANRRVDIRLVPEVGACGALTLEPSQPPAPPVAAN
jgi:outer membrane protein OmpA-like peptidoglycan-associated protein